MQSVSTDISLEVVDGPESAVEDDWWHYAYKLRLRYQGRTMTTPWKQGEGLTDPPSATDVLEAMLADASSLENAESFEDWAAELGYDEDSRKAEKIYKAVQRQTEKLRQLLGDDFQSMLYPEEA